MHNSVFGEHCADAGCWYAIILKSIRIRARHRDPERAFVFTGTHAGAEKNHPGIIIMSHVSDGRTEENNSKCKRWIEFLPCCTVEGLLTFTQIPSAVAYVSAYIHHFEIIGID